MLGVRRSLVFSFCEKYSVSAVNLVMTAVVARLLTPDEIGVFMIGSAVLIMTDSLRDFGVSVYLIQEREITREGVRTAFTVMLLSSAAFAGLLWILAGPIAAFYEEQGIELILRFAAIGVLLVPFCSPIMALLRRDMEFDKIAIIGISGAATNFVSVVMLAALGFGYMSLAWGSLMTIVVNVSLALLFRPQFWMFRPTLLVWRKVFRFGGYSTATLLLNNLYQMLPQLILGRILTFDAVGLYNRAIMLSQLPERTILGALHPVVLPALAARARVGGDLKEPYLRGITYMTAVQWPFLVVLALLADPVVHLLLGSQWMAAAPLVRIIALASLCLFPAFMTYPVLVAVGRVKDTLTTSLITLPISIALVFAAAHIGLAAVAASMFLTAPFQVYVALRFIRRHVPFAWGDLAAATWKSAVTTLGAAAAPAAAIALTGFRFDLSVPVMLVTGAGAAIGWMVGLSLTGHPLLAELRGASRAAAAVKTFCFARLRRAAIS